MRSSTENLIDIGPQLHLDGDRAVPVIHVDRTTGFIENKDREKVVPSRLFDDWYGGRKRWP